MHFPTCDWLSALLCKKAFCVKIVLEMLHNISSPSIARIYNIHYYLKVASDGL